jgi:PAS domain S-box-containing protein
MESQDTKFNYKIILAALVAVILAILIAFYYSYAQSKTQIDFLEQEKAILVKDLTIMKADVDRLSALNEVNEIELQDSKFKVQQLLDSVGKLNFTVERLREFKTELSRLEAKNDSLKLKNNFLRYNKLLWDDNMLSLYGLKPNDFDNDFEAWEKVVHPEDRARCQMELEKTIKYKTDYQTEFRIVTPTGTVKQIKAIAKSFRDESGQTIKLIGANWDVTDMKNTQEKLAQSLFTFTEIFEKSAVGMALVSPAGKWLKVNKSLCQILGYPEEELLNLSIDDVTYQDDLEKSKKNIHNAVHDQLDNYQLDKCYVHKNGHLVHTIINVTVVRTEAGSVQHFIGQVLDITSKINAEQRLNELLQVSKAQNKSLLNFAHIVSHNLRSHTSNLSMLSKFMMEEEDLEEQAKLNQMFLNATERLSETIYHLNEVVRVKTMVKDKLTKIDLNTIIKNTENSLKGILLENNVKISVKVPEGTSVMGIPAYMESILLNLYTNAIKYAMPQRRPFIEIWSKEKKGLVHIFVKDNGLGIDLKRHGEHIFGMYKTFHKHKDAKGIGLFITKNQVEAMTGTITVQSAVHQGTTFKIKLKNGRSYAGED